MKHSRVLLVAGHSVVRLGLRTLLTANTTTVVGEAADPVEAEALAAALQPDLVVLDAGQPDGEELKLLRRIAVASPPARIILLSDREDEAFVEQALMFGASCYLLKQTAAADLGWAIKAAQKGREYFSPMLIQRLRDPAATVAEPDQLQGLTGPVVSGIEGRLMKMINQGMIIRQLAQELRTNIGAIRSYRHASPAGVRRRHLAWRFAWNIAERLLTFHRRPHPASPGAV